MDRGEMAAVIVLPAGRPALDPAAGFSMPAGGVGYALIAASRLREVAVALTAPLRDGTLALGAFVRPVLDGRASGSVAEAGVHWFFLGLVRNDEPSAVFRIPWPAEALGAPEFDAQLALVEQPAAALAALPKALPPAAEEHRMLARYVATDLFRFVESFSKRDADGRELLLLPTGVLDRWLNRFESKLACDPYFWTQSQNLL